MSEGQLTEAERFDLLYREWEYRHRVFWLTFHIWGGLVGLTILSPFLKPKMLDLGWPALLVPLAGFCIALLGWVHLGGEAKRMGLVFEQLTYRRTRDWPHPWDAAMTRKQSLQSLGVGKLMANVFGYVLAPACISTALVMGILIHAKIGFRIAFEGADYVRLGCFVLAVALPVGGAWLNIRRARRAAIRKADAKAKLAAGAGSTGVQVRPVVK